MFLSALEDVQDKAKGFEAGGNDYLVKPFEILEVQARVRSLLRAKAYADAVKEKIAYELQIAREIQMGILPPDVAAVTAGTGLEAHALLEPAQAIRRPQPELLDEVAAGEGAGDVLLGVDEADGEGRAAPGQRVKLLRVVVQVEDHLRGAAHGRDHVGGASQDGLPHGDPVAEVLS